jgi:uncharacterized membrane protein YfhO
MRTKGQTEENSLSYKYVKKANLINKWIYIGMLAIMGAGFLVLVHDFIPIFQGVELENDWLFYRGFAYCFALPLILLAIIELTVLFKFPKYALARKYSLKDLETLKEIRSGKEQKNEVSKRLIEMGVNDDDLIADIIEMCAEYGITDLAREEIRFNNFD